MLTSSRAIIRRLERENWVCVRIRGSHHQFINEETGRRVTVPHPKRSIPIGTLINIYKSAGWPKD